MSAAEVTLIGLALLLAGSGLVWFGMWLGDRRW